jgi:hypothetical protein
MNDGQAGVSRAADDRSERPDGPGGWWQADDGFWYPPAAGPAAPANGYDTGGPGSTMAALQAAASRWAATPDPAATGSAGTWASTPAEPGGGPSAAEPGGPGPWAAEPGGRWATDSGGGPPAAGPSGAWAASPAEPDGGASATGSGGGPWAAESGGTWAAEPDGGASATGSGGGAWGAEPGGGAWGAGQGPGGGDDALTAPVTMAGNGWGGEGVSSPPLYAPAEAPRAPGMAETFRSWPLWARVAAPMAAAFVALVLVGGAVAAVAGEPEETDAPAPAEPACHPSYSGCVPMASDVDCAGGSGDGPEYTGMVTVIGTDEYDLDSDNDGVACEP